MPDVVLTCSDCRTEFIFTASEAAFFQSKDLTPPKRCKLCRQKRREAKGETMAPAAPLPSKRQTQWVGGGESETPDRRKDKRRDRRSGGDF